LTPNRSKEVWPPPKTPRHKNKNLFRQTAIFQELKYIYITNMYVCNTTNRLKCKKRKMRRRSTRRIRKIRRDKKRRIRRDKKRKIRVDV
jgi:hypothetical protein